MVSRNNLVGWILWPQCVVGRPSGVDSFAGLGRMARSPCHTECAPAETVWSASQIPRRQVSIARALPHRWLYLSPAGWLYVRIVRHQDALPRALAASAVSP